MIFGCLQLALPCVIPVQPGKRRGGLLQRQTFATSMAHVLRAGWSNTQIVWPVETRLHIVHKTECSQLFESFCTVW